MADAYIGEIRLLPYQYAPANWVTCNGQRLNINQFQVLYAVIFNRYGGDGRTYFNVPNLNGRVAVGSGNNPTDGFDPLVGNYGGAVQEAMLPENFPPHRHNLKGRQLPQSQRSATPQDNMLTGIAYRPPSGVAPTASPYVSVVDPATKATLHPGTLTAFVGGRNGEVVPRENRQPALAMQWCICVYDGVFPIKP